MKVVYSTLLFLLMSSSAFTRPLIVAHRGASGEAPENTIPAFELAWTQSADAIEGDFHLTRDAKIVCLHDRDTKKIAGQKLIVKALNADGVSMKAVPSLTKSYIQTIKAAGFEFHVWTVNCPEQAKQLADDGVNSITTDYPGRILEALKEGK